MKQNCLVVTLIVAIMASASISFGQTDIGVKGIGGHLGFVLPEDPISSTIAFGANVDLGTIIPQLRIGAGLEYWSAGYEFAGVTTEDFKLSDIAILASVKYMFSLEGSKFSPYAGGGLGFHRFSVPTYKLVGVYPNISYEKSSESETELELHVLGGVLLPLSPQMDAFVEARYDLGDVDIFGIYGGINYKLK